MSTVSFSRILRIVSAAVAAALIFVANSGEAQTAWRVAHTTARPILVFQTPTLTAGIPYEIETVVDGIEDTVLTVTTSSSTAPVTQTGSDGCARTNNVFPSCVTFTPTTTATYRIVVRAYVPAASGETTLRIQQRSGSLPLGTGPCTPNLPVTTGCWSQWPNLSFGGITRALGSSATNYHFETREITGATTAPHLIYFMTTANSNQAGNWNLVGRWWANHRTALPGLAEYQGPLPSGITISGSVLAGPWLASSPMELVRNDAGSVGGVPFGVDTDLDQLGAELESSLRTCDSNSTPTYGGIACSTLRGCTSTSDTAARCRASLRDTDQDGYEDFLEFYGYDDGFAGELAILPRYGADPAHYDVFVEMDALTSAPLAPAGQCSYNDAQWIDRTEGEQIAAIYASATASQFPNRNGPPGIALHLDVPPAPPLANGASPLSGSATVGVWGGASCIRVPVCTSNADCAVAGPTSTCPAPDPMNPSAVRLCNPVDAPLAYMQAERRWLFRLVTMYQGGAGETYPNTMFSSASGPSEALHELGHQGALGHSGPFRNSVSDSMNWRPTFQSRMNYTFMGYKDPERDVGGLPYPAEYGLVTFSDGSRAPLDPMATPESCPFGAGATQSMVPFEDLFDYPTTVGGCPNVDWDRDTQALPPGQTAPSQLWQNTSSLRYFARSPDAVSRMEVLYRPVDLAVTGNVLRIVRNVKASPSDTQPPRLTLLSTTSYACNNLPSSGADRFPYCNLQHGGVEAPLLTDAGSEIVTRSFAVTDVVTPTGVNEMLIVWRVGSQLRWGRLQQTSTTSQLDSMGVIPSTVHTQADDGTGLVALARTPTGALLVYRDTVGQLRSQRMTWSGSPGTPSWASPGIILHPGLTGSPGLAHAYGTASFPAGLIMALAAGNLVTLYTSSDGTSWTLRRTLDMTEPVVGAPGVEVGVTRAQGTVSGERIFVVAQTQNAAGTRVAMSDHASFNFTAPFNRMYGSSTLASAPVAMTRDTTRSPVGIRAVGVDLVPGRRCEAGDRPCNPGEACTFVGPTRWCFVGSLPAGAVDCSPAGTNGVCPTGFTCETQPNGAVCAVAGAVPVLERATGSGDGVVPGIHEMPNEWPVLRAGFCWSLRNARGTNYAPASWSSVGAPTALVNVGGSIDPRRATCSLDALPL